MTIICSIILFTTWCFSFLNAICISKVPGHYINRKIQASTARTAVKGAQRKILMKSPEPGNKAQRKVKYKNYDAITMSRNYEEKLLQEIMTVNYQLVYQ